MGQTNHAEIHFLRVFIICIRESFVVSGGLEGGNKLTNRREYGTAVNLLHARAQYHKLSNICLIDTYTYAVTYCIRQIVSAILSFSFSDGCAIFVAAAISRQNRIVRNRSARCACCNRSGIIPMCYKREDSPRVICRLRFVAKWLCRTWRKRQMKRD